MMTLDGQLYIYPETSVSFIAIYSITFSYFLISSILFYSSFSSKGVVFFFYFWIICLGILINL